MSQANGVKKKWSQLELRQYMRKHKSKEESAENPKKIDSPLAKYNDQGQLMCVLCKSIVRSEAVWPVHINAKQHKGNVELAKKLKEKTNNFTTPLKRPLTPPLEISNKKPKSILKNSTESKNNSAEDFEALGKSELPNDFFDKASKQKQGSFNKTESISNNTGKGELDQKDETLPEGFFDDPKLDAKARNQEYRDPIQEEWEKFQKEIRDVEGESAAIIAEDQEEATTERQIDEIDEQMKNFSKVLELEKKKTEIFSKIPNSMDVNMEEDEEDADEEFDEFLDWRSKNSLR